MSAKVPVLDHGYIQYINSMGDEESIVRAARQSTDGSFRSWEPYEGHPRGDAGFLAFLYRNDHSSPFEMCELVLEVQAPIFVFREWMRHRTFCLRGATQVTCVMPNGNSYKRSIKEIYELKYGQTVDTSARIKNGTSKQGKAVTRSRRLKVEGKARALSSCQERTLKVLDESTGLFATGRMEDVWESGVKPVFEVKTAKGQAIGASEDHLFYTKEGWKKLKELKVGDFLATPGLVATAELPYPPALRKGIGVWTSMMRKRLLRLEDQCYVCEQLYPAENLDLDHVIPVVRDLKLALDAANLRPICKNCHRVKTNEEQTLRQSKTAQGVRWTPIVSISPVGEEMTYDIAVEGPHHNFVADGVVVHNSYNEMSGRYVQMPNLHYVPSRERMVEQSKTNKQGSAEVMLDPELGDYLMGRFEEEQTEIYRTYQKALDNGLAKEVARVNTPVSRYSRMWVKGNLRNWLHFLKLRMASNAQYEIRVYADEVAKIVQQLWPRTWALFEEHTLYAGKLSRTELKEYTAWKATKPR